MDLERIAEFTSFDAILQYVHERKRVARQPDKRIRQTYTDFDYIDEDEQQVNEKDKVLKVIFLVGSDSLLHASVHGEGLPPVRNPTAGRVSRYGPA